MQRRSIIAGILAGLLLLSVSHAMAAEKLRIGWVYAMANAPAIVAEKQGLFKKYGIDVEVIEFTSGPLLFQALAGQQIDIGYVGFAPATHWYGRGLKTTTVAKVNYGQSAVLVRKDSGINNLQDLKGKKIAGVRKGSGMDALLRGYVLKEKAGLEPDKDAQIVAMPPGNMGASLMTRVVDAAFMWEPFTTQFLLTGETKIVFDMNEAEPHYPWYVVAVRSELLRKNRDSVVKVLRAHKDAIELLNKNEAVGNEIIAERFRLQSVDDGGGKSVKGVEIARQARQRLGFEYAISDKDMAFFDRQIEWSRSLGFLTGDFKAKDLVDLSLLEEITKEKPKHPVKTQKR